MITSEKVFAVAKTLADFHKDDNPKIDMGMSAVWPRYKESNYCNSPGCHAGDYLAAKFHKKPEFFRKHLNDLAKNSSDEAIFMEGGDDSLEAKARDCYEEQLHDRNPEASDDEIEEIMLTSDLSFIKNWARDIFDDDYSGNQSYHEGMEEMAKDLGFKNHKELEDWAKNNPKIWGNKFGSEMFSSELAFGFSENTCDIMHADDIMEHWIGVGQRLRAHEKGETLNEQD